MTAVPLTILSLLRNSLETRDSDTTLTGIYNTGITVTNARVWWGEFEAWLNEQEITNILSVPVLGSACYIVSSHTKNDWVVFTPKGKIIVVKRDTIVCKVMSYIYLCSNKAGLAMIEMVC